MGLYLRPEVHCQRRDTRFDLVKAKFALDCAAELAGPSRPKKVRDHVSSTLSAFASVAFPHSLGQLHHPFTSTTGL